jgi:hypothetical protein
MNGWQSFIGAGIGTVLADLLIKLIERWRKRRRRLRELRRAFELVEKGERPNLLIGTAAENIPAGSLCAISKGSIVRARS